MVNRNELTRKSIKELKKICKENDIKGFSGKKKEEIIDLIVQYLGEDKPHDDGGVEGVPENRDDSGKEEDIEDGDSDEVVITDAMIDNMKAKFWQRSDEFRTLLDPDVIKKIDFTKYDLAKLLNDFFGEMFKEDYIDFRVSGIAVHSAAKIHRWKITEVLKEQEKEEEERKREMLRRQIPTALSQPLRPARKIATQEDFMGAMRRAIIDVMRTREKQRKRMEKKQEQGEGATRKSTKKKKLPESIRKAILGKERIEETFDRWYEIIRKKAKEKKNGKVSFFKDLKPEIKVKDRYQYRFELARLFMSFMFLRNRGKLEVEQEGELTDILISIPKNK